MTPFELQAKRIREKIKEAASQDKDFKVFGASRHQYMINDPATAEDIAAFEKDYSIELPECYKTFLMQVGNGGKSYGDSAAGPFYGIYPLGKGVGEVLDNPEKYLKNECIIFPDMTNEYWTELNKNIDNNEDIPDDEYEKELGKIFAGILPIGSQGCTYFHGIILNGKYI
jgi:hypothetical protein